MPRKATAPDAGAEPASLPVQVVRKGRGATFNIAHRYESVERAIDGDALEHARLEGELDELPPLATTVSFETAHSLITYNDSPDIAFDRSINPYRGCEHGCVYCYARPTHSYLNLSPGLDFETRLVAKSNAAEALVRDLAAPAYRAATLALGTVTDCYQPVERELRLTRAVIEVLGRCRHPFGIVTKSSLIERDLDLLAPLAAERLFEAFISITTLDSSLSRTLEPRAASPARRLRTVETLSRAGVAVHVNFAPVIPFVNEPELERVLQAARDAGAVRAHYTIVRLPWEVAPLFEHWLQAHCPERAQRVMNRIREMRAGRNYDARFGARMKGEGVWADLIGQRFRKAAARLGLDRPLSPLRAELFSPPKTERPQLDLF